MYNWKYNLNITYRHRKTGIETKKTIVLSRGEESSLENILRITFGIPKDEGILLNCSDTIFYPVSMVNLEVAANAPTCELQSFSLAALNNGENNVEFFMNVSFFYVLFLFTVQPTTQQQPVSQTRLSKKSKTSKTSSAAVTGGDGEGGKEDKRKFNRGLDQRRSYL
jgi:hypothetical protein